MMMMFSFFLNFLEITLMESDTLSDDVVETKTFDLTALELNKVYQKTFVFRQVKCEYCLFCHIKRVTQRSVTESQGTYFKLSDVLLLVIFFRLQRLMWS